MTATAVDLPRTAARTRARRPRRGWGNAGLLVPFLIFYALFLVGPTANLIEIYRNSRKPGAAVKPA